MIGRSYAWLTFCACLVGGLTANAQGTNPPAPAGTNNQIATAVVADRDVIARGKGFQITRAELDEEVIRFKGDLVRLGRGVPVGQEALVDRSVLESLIQLRMLKAKATSEELENARRTAQERFETEKKNAGDEETFQRRLKIAGLTPESFLARVTDVTLAEAVLERLLAVNVSDQDVKKFYDENPEQFEQPESVRLAHILFLTRDPQTGRELSEEEKQAKLKTAQDVLKRIRAGEDFAALARQYSEDPGTRDDGGVIARPIPKGMLASDLPEFEATAFKLGTNQVSDVVTTKIGYHIIKVLEKTPAQMIELAKVSDDIKRYLKRRQIQAGAPKLFEQLRKEFNVEITDEKLKAVELPGQEPSPAEQPAAKN